MVWKKVRGGNILGQLVQTKTHCTDFNICVSCMRKQIQSTKAESPCLLCGIRRKVTRLYGQVIRQQLTRAETIVNNESSEIIRMFYSEFDAFIPTERGESAKGEAGLFPPHLRSEIEEMNEWVYDTINNGVYKIGFASSQQAYQDNIFPLFKSLDRVEAHLGNPEHQPYLFGKHITEADIRLYTTIARFDVAYFTIFKCNLKMIRYEYPNLHLWLRRLYWDESGVTRGAFKKTTFFDQVSVKVILSKPMLIILQYKSGYTRAAGGKQIVPAGPVPDIMPL
jgi:putative glutathione S-transferase